MTPSPWFFLELPVFLPGMESGWRVIRVAFVVWRVFHRWMLDPPYLFFNTGGLNRQVLINCKEIICTSLAELVPELCCIYRLSIYKDDFTDISVKYLKWLVYRYMGCR